MTMPYDDAGTSRVTRFEVFTGARRRRDWPPEVKASILAESFSGQETVCSVARRHGMSPSQLKDNAGIRRAWLRYYDVEPDQFDFILASWDTASTLSEEADWSVGTIWGVADGSIYLLHVERKRLESPELRHRIESIHSQFHADVTIIEDAALGRGIVQDLRRTSPTCQPIAIPVRIEKIARMQARAVMFETGKVSRNFREAGTAA